MKFIRKLIAAATLVLARKPAQDPIKYWANPITQPEPERRRLTRKAEPEVVEVPTGRTWRKGPPPHAGWWNASRSRDTEVWRWWNGARWSADAFSEMGAYMAADIAGMPSIEHPAQIEWSDYWPENAGIERSAPAATVRPLAGWPFPAL